MNECPRKECVEHPCKESHVPFVPENVCCSGETKIMVKAVLREWAVDEPAVDLSAVEVESA